MEAKSEEFVEKYERWREHLAFTNVDPTWV